MEGLLRYDEHNQIVPGVAERWEIREDGATFWLREDARWSGRPAGHGGTISSSVGRTGLNPVNASEYAFHPLSHQER